MKYVFFYFFLISLFLISCNGNKGAHHVPAAAIDTIYVVKYAKGFSVTSYPDYKEVTLRDPWDTTKILQNYILVEKNKPLPSNLPKGTLIRTPLTSVVAYSTIHCSTFDAIDVLSALKGVCEPEYIDIPYVQKGLSEGSIVNLGQASHPDIEKIIEISPEAIWATPLEGKTYGSIDKTGIPVIQTTDYMENTPLGRAEWIRFYSLFFDNESYVDSIFDITVKNYQEIKEKTANVSKRPTVFLDKMYSGSWYISGGNTFISEMLHDAGARYVWEDDSRINAVPLSFEQVLDKAGDADFWLIKYYQSLDLTYRELEKEYKPYSYFGAFKNRNTYGCNTNNKKYYEDLPIHPDYILQDMAYIFHPELFPGYSPRYYSKLKE